MNVRMGLRCRSCVAAMMLLLAWGWLPSALPALHGADADAGATGDAILTNRLPTGSTAADAPSTNVSAELRATYEAVEQLRRDMEQTASRNAEAITSGLSLIEPTLARMHERQMEAVQSSNRTILLAAGVFAAVGFFGLIFISLILVRAIGRFSELAVANSPRPLLGQGTALAVPALGPGESPGGRGAAEQAAGRFQGAIEQLQHRIHELEQELHTPPQPLLPSQRARSTSSGQAAEPVARPELPLPSELAPSELANIQPLRPAAEATPPSRASVLLGKGQALLSLDAPEQALNCFEEALRLDPGNADALVKRGMAYEKLEDWDRALDSYNRAIATDATLTVAYLYRGGVCNRLQRYREALESYEEALRTEKKSRAS